MRRETEGFKNSGEMDVRGDGIQEEDVHEEAFCICEFGMESSYVATSERGLRFFPGGV